MRVNSFTRVRLATARTLETAGVSGRDAGISRVGSLGTTLIAIWRKEDQHNRERLRMISDFLDRDIARKSQVIKWASKEFLMLKKQAFDGVTLPHLPEGKQIQNIWKV